MTLYTEAEAAERWCPFAMVAEGGSNVPFSFNRVQHRVGSQIGAPPGAMCIGSKCMAFRWAAASTNPLDERRGYCGAFGKVDDL